MLTKEELHGLAEERAANICAITAVKDGQVVYEDFWNGYGPGDARNVMSVTKSVMSLLTGIAVDKGYIRSIDDKVLDYFPDYEPKRGEKTIRDVTIKHLLTMTAPYKGKSEPWKKICTSGDWTKGALDILGGRQGITGEFRYSTLGIQILSGIIERASGMKTLEFANRYLFGPLGIPEVADHGDSSKEDQMDYALNRAPRKREWYSDPTGCVTAGWGLSLTSSDMALIGQLCLEKGRDIVPESWIKEMTIPRQKLGEMFGNNSYGYLWWIMNEEKGIYAAMGDGGNVIYVDPGKNITVGIISYFKPRVIDRVDFIEENIIPFIDRG